MKQHNRLILIFGFLFSLMISFTPFSVLGLALSTVLWAAILPFPKRIDSFILRLVLSVCLIACFVQITGVVAWVAGLEYSPQIAITLQLLALLAANKFRIPKHLPKYKLINTSDATSIIVTLMTLALLGSALVADSSLAGLLRINTNGFDDTIHTSLSINVYENKGYIYGDAASTIDKIIYPELVAYPQGWYLSNTVWWNAIDDNLSISESPRPLIFLYTVSKIVWFGIIIFLFNRLILFLAKRSLGNLRIPHFLAAALFTISAELLLFFGVYKFGFSSFMPLLAFSLALCFLLVDQKDSEKKDNKDLKITILLSGMLASGITMSWLLGAPLGYLAIVFYLMHYFDYKLLDIIYWAKHNLTYVLFLSVVLIIGASQLFIQIAFSVNDNLINTEGGLWKVSLPVLGLGMVAFSIIYSSSKYRQIRHLSYLFIPSFLVAGGVYFVQYFTAGNSTYYSTKTLYVPFMLVLVFVSTFVLIKLRTSIRHEAESPNIGIVLLLSILIILPNILRLDLNIVNQVSGKQQKISPYSSSQIESIINQRDFDGNIIIYKTLDYEEDVIGTNYLAMLGRDRTECQRKLNYYQLTNNYPLIESQIGMCAEERNSKTYVITSSKTYPNLSQAYANNQKIVVLLSN